MSLKYLRRGVVKEDADNDDQTDLAHSRCVLSPCPHYKPSSHFWALPGSVQSPCPRYKPTSPCRALPGSVSRHVQFIGRVPYLGRSQGA